MDATIALALQLLLSIGAPARVVLVAEPPATFDARQATAVDAWVMETEGTVFVAGWSALYAQARRGHRDSLIGLAAAIAHEACHLAQPPSATYVRDGVVTQYRRPETPCYDVQIDTLVRLGSSHTQVRRIEAIRTAFAKREGVR